MKNICFNEKKKIIFPNRKIISLAHLKATFYDVRISIASLTLLFFEHEESRKRGRQRNKNDYLRFGYKICNTTIYFRSDNFSFALTSSFIRLHLHLNALSVEKKNLKQNINI